MLVGYKCALRLCVSFIRQSASRLWNLWQANWSHLVLYIGSAACCNGHATSALRSENRRMETWCFRDVVGADLAGELFGPHGHGNHSGLLAPLPTQAHVDMDLQSGQLEQVARCVLVGEHVDELPCTHFQCVGVVWSQSRILLCGSCRCRPRHHFLAHDLACGCVPRHLHARLSEFDPCHATEAAVTIRSSLGYYYSS